MVTFTNEIIINKPLYEVFQFFQTMENLPKWNYYIKKVIKLTDTSGIGTRYHQIRVGDEQHYEIIELVPNKIIVVETLSDSRPYFKRESRFSGEAVTVINDTFHINTPFPQFIEKFLISKPKNAVKANLTKLKELLENGEVVLQDGTISHL